MVAKEAAKKKTKSQTGQVLLESVKSIGNMPIVGMLVAEFIGAFLLTAIFLIVSGQPLYIAFALIGIVLIVGSISGAHLNPAITVGALVTRKISMLRAIGYIAAQIIGAIVAFVVLDAFAKSGQTTAVQSFIAQGSQIFEAAKLSEVAKDKEWIVFFAELLGTTILSLGIATAIRAKRDKVTAALTQSFTILIALVVAGTATSSIASGLTFLNPAITLAAKGLSWSIWPITVYVVAPIIGAVIGFALQDFLRVHSEKTQA